MTGLAVDGVTIRFGGLTAVRDLTLQAPLGRLTGLIGPNGAGKTTTFNACTGVLRPTAGTVAFDGADVTGLGVAARSRRGLGRTFQRMELFDSMTVAQNVALGREAGWVGSSVVRHLFSSPKERAELNAATGRTLATCGIALLADRQVAALSTGERRLVELARVLNGEFRMLLLDEPSSGLDHDETASFGELLRGVVSDRGIGILLVEHDMSLVMSVCEYLYVLDFGQLIFEGTTEEAASSDVVRAAYLGSAEVEA